MKRTAIQERRRMINNINEKGRKRKNSLRMYKRRNNINYKLLSNNESNFVK